MSDCEHTVILLWHVSPLSTGTYTAAVDTYSLGVLVMELAGLNPPRSHASRTALYDSERELAVAIAGEDFATKALRPMWHHDASQRPSSKAVLAMLSGDFSQVRDYFALWSIACEHLV